MAEAVVTTSYYHGLQNVRYCRRRCRFPAASTSIHMNNECMEWMVYYHISHVQMRQWRKSTLKTIGPKEKLATKDPLRPKKNREEKRTRKLGKDCVFNNGKAKLFYSLIDRIKYPFQRMASSTVGLFCHQFSACWIKWNCVHICVRFRSALLCHIASCTLSLSLACSLCLTLFFISFASFGTILFHSAQLLLSFFHVWIHIYTSHIYTTNRWVNNGLLMVILEYTHKLFW